MGRVMRWYSEGKKNPPGRLPLRRVGAGQGRGGCWFWLGGLGIQ